MTRHSLTPNRITVSPCPEQAGCFRWTITAPDGRLIERSRFAHSCAHGARIVGEVRAREIGVRL